MHLIRGTMPGMKEGTIIGHEAVGVVVEAGSGVRNFAPGDRVVVPSTISCGYCSYCRAGYQAQCDNANPGGKLAGTAFFGGPEAAGGFDGLQAEYARIPYSSTSLVPIPPGVSDAQAIMVSDIFPTAWFGAKLAEVGTGDSVAVFGAGPVGQLAVLSAYLQGAGRVIAVDHNADRLALAQAQHAEIVNFDTEEPVAAIQELTGGIGVDRVIDAVGVDAERPATGVPAEQAREFDTEQREAAPEGNPAGSQWVPGDAPSQVSQWAAAAVAKAGTIGIIGVYPQTISTYPIGVVMNKNLTVKAGNCNHRHYMPDLLRLVAEGGVDPALLLTEHEPMTDVMAAYREFDRREPGWIKVALNPAA
ncbi:alcohol dehydrogenase catalytic domain-containing protein [Paractinoplanes pyxinae]|uniref:alcohol dehydrogenase catalytic domain-containing protein n=1 Tax=Paractinoplanes pyxinae TaxID=2997416 RepID=UPI002D1E3737|nr:alcohol dehydrogenase catalytic domain-containing protein [Actinoplanes pyxinae]